MLYLWALFRFILMTRLGGGLHYPHFTDEEPEAWAACPGHTAGEAGLESTWKSSPSLHCCAQPTVTACSADAG